MTLQEIQEQRLASEKFQKSLDRFPDKSIIEKTPDNRANSLPISHVEKALDQYYFGQWGTQNFTWQVLQNEIFASIELWVIHPITAVKITRIGSASAQITVDAIPFEEKSKMTKKEQNAYALNIENKKPNSLYLLSGKVKAECFKNAAATLGKVFGRDLNRKSVGVFEGLVTTAQKSLPASKLQQLPPLNPISEKWAAAKQAVQSGDYTIEQVLEKYSVSPENIERLKHDAI